jgi:hypothetical protein
MKRLIKQCAVIAVAALGLGACEQQLEVANPNNPDSVTVVVRS